jgi:hypothetical protein
MTKFQPARFLLVALILGSSFATQAAPAASQPFESVVEGSAIKTTAEAGKLISPLPGIAVSVTARSSVAVVRAQVTKSADAITSRDVVLKLDEGSLSFSIDKRIVDKTRFEVQTPHGRKSGQGAVGTVTVQGSCVKYASLTGKMNITATGVVPIQLKAGSFLAICGEGANARMRVINAIARTWTDYSANGSPLATRDATVAELESTRPFFSAALTEASLAEGAGLLGPASAADITRVLTMINQSFAGVGLAAIESSSVGALPAAGRSTSASGDATASGGFGGGSFNPANTLGVSSVAGSAKPANPANTSGDVNSPER